MALPGTVVTDKTVVTVEIMAMGVFVTMAPTVRMDVSVVRIETLVVIADVMTGMTVVMGKYETTVEIMVTFATVTTFVGIVIGMTMVYGVTVKTGEAEIMDTTVVSVETRVMGEAVVTVGAVVMVGAVVTAGAVVLVGGVVSVVGGVPLLLSKGLLRVFLGIGLDTATVAMNAQDRTMKIRILNGHRICCDETGGRVVCKLGSENGRRACNRLLFRGEE